MITNNTYVNGNKPPKYYINNHRVRSMYYNDNLIFHHIPCLQILLNAHELVLTLKGTFTLKTTLVPADCNEDVVFESTDENVAIIENGIIKPKALGNCVINVMCGNIIAKCKVAVKSETIILYNKGVVNNDSEFGEIVFPNRVEFQTTQMFMNLVGASSDYSALWLSWSNRIEFSEYVSLNIHIENPNDHSTIIGLTRNTVTGMKGYETGRVTAVDGDTFVGDRTITTLLKGTSDHSLNMDLVGGDTGFMGLYFKRKTDSNDSADEHILINTIQVIRKDAYIVGSGEDISEDFEIPCTGIIFKEDELLFSYLGDPITTNLANILDRTPGDTDEPVIWAIIEGDDTITLSDTGILTVNGKGFSSVQAICGEYFDDIRITSIIESTGVTLNVYDLSFTVLGTQQVLTATVIPTNTTDSIIWYSSNNRVATVNNGVVTSVGIGSCTITAICGNKSATCNVNVSVACTGISLNTNIINFDTINGKESLVSIVTPSNTTDTVTWESSNTNIATVINGIVTSVGIGSCTITATCGNNSTTCNVNVSVTCTALALDITLIQFNAKGLTQVLTVTPSPSNTTDIVTWKSSNNRVATVNNGVVTSVSDGTCTITATCGDKTAVCEVTVYSNRPCEQIALSKNSLSFDSLEATKVLTAELTPSNTTDTVTWESSNNDVATVSNGVVTSVGNGTCTITATCAGKTATCIVTVSVACREITFDIESLTIGINAGTYNVAQYVNVIPISCQLPVIWSINKPSVATIDSNGILTPKSVGNFGLTATCGDKSATIDVYIEAEPIDILIDTITIEVGETYDATRLYTLQDGYNVQYKYTSIISIQNHIICGEEIGTTNLEIICGDIIKNVTVKVIAPSVVECTSISVSPTTMTVNVGDFVAFYSEISVRVQPSNCTQPVTFRTGNSDVMSPSIAAEGVYQAWGPGTTTLTAYCGNQWANCRVTVLPDDIPCTGITLKATPSDTISIGEEVYINVTLSPSNCTENYTMSKSGSAIGENGYVGLYIGQSVGSSTVTVRCGNVSKSITIYVNRN